LGFSSVVSGLLPINSIGYEPKEDQWYLSSVRQIMVVEKCEEDDYFDDCIFLFFILLSPISTIRDPPIWAISDYLISLTLYSRVHVEILFPYILHLLAILNCHVIRNDECGGCTFQVHDRQDQSKDLHPRALPALHTVILPPLARNSAVAFTIKARSSDLDIVISFVVGGLYYPTTTIPCEWFND